ncbi:MAG: hypothetical protein KDA63_01615, partial [Planctomycetales bacterium]|nr:hypothetical protein [Planctomycetales bacterium]
QPRFDQTPPSTAAPVTFADVMRTRSTELLNDPAAIGVVYDTLLQEVEEPLLRGAMEQFNNECAPAARVLGLHRTTLKKKLLQHEIHVPRDDD